LSIIVLASIPSPTSSSIELGPFTFRAYGLMIALGVLAAVWLTGKRLAERGYKADHATGLAMWVVPAGLIGARMYHVITDWRSFQGQWFDVVKIWEGGLGILGGVVAGAIAGVAYARKYDIILSDLFDIVAPAVPLAQAIGRWGNWFNQELFGRPTDLPWGLEIDVENRPDEFINEDTFHPTFLYESLWNFGLVLLLLKLDRSRRLRPWGLFATYLAGYSAGRLWIEALRVDHASEIAGLRVNLWVFSVVFLSSLYVVIRSIRRPDELVLDDQDDPSDDEVSDLDDDYSDDDVDETRDEEESIDID
jgi:prolipoprotein diacylglyceryl transferase